MSEEQPPDPFRDPAAALSAILAELEKLRRENQRLRSENSALRAENETNPKLRELLLQFKPRLAELSALVDRFDYPRRISLDTKLDVIFHLETVSARTGAVIDSVFPKSLRTFVQKTPEDLRKLRNCGRQTVLEIQRVLEREGLRLGMTEDDLADYERPASTPPATLTP